MSNRHIGRMAALGLAFAPLLPACPARAADPGFTLAQVLGAPFPAGLTAAPSGGRAAWVFNDHGARNVWITATDGDHGRGHALTSYTGDDGIDVGDLAWAPDGRSLVYTRGGSLEGGPPVNPLSLTSGPPEQTVWLAEVPTGTQHKIGAGHGAAVSPAGGLVAFLSGGQIWTASASGGPAAQRVHDRGDDSGLAWSPDGSRLAFVSSRAGRSILGVLDVKADRITWMSPGFDSDMAPEWSPDGKRIAFLRIPAGQEAIDFAPRREGPPWSIMVCDAATGTGHAVWTALAGKGSVFHGTLGARVLLWAAGDRLVFPWERTGWVHLYTVPAAGGEAKELTTGGNFEVFNVALSADRSTVAYSANAGDIDRWHLWTVAAAGGAPVQVTKGTGIEDYPVLASDGALLALHADAQNPLRPVRVAAGGAMEDVAPGAIPADFPAAKMVTPQPVVFPASDGLPVHGQLFLPPAQSGARGPAMLFFHGGPYRQMLPAWHPMDAYSWMYAFNQYLANQGTVVLSVNYRGGIGYGLDFREAPGFGSTGASELKDILGAGAYLRARADVDPKRIGIWGGSYGGLMTALGLARAPDLFVTGVDYAGVHDWRSQLPQLTGAAAQLAFDSSALATVDRWRAPVLIVHNDDDRDVPFAQSIELVEALRKRGLPFDDLVIPDEGHVMMRAQSWLRFFTVSDGYLAQHMVVHETH